MFTSQILIFLISAAFRMIQQHLAYNQENRRRELDALLKTNELESENRAGIRKLIKASSLFSFTTSVLAVFAFAFIIGAPVFAAFTGVPVYYGYVELVEGWSFLFFSGSGGQDMMFQMLPGLVILPYQTELIAAIAGLYFGGLNRRHR